MADELTEEQVEQFRVAFTLFDRDADGIITPGELGTVMRSLGMNMTQAEVQRMVDEVDEDGNGQIEFEEFLAMMAKKMAGGDTEEDLIEAFKVFDDEQNGYVSASQLRQLVTSMGDKMTVTEVDDMMRVARVDSDKIDYMEFVKVLFKKAE